MLNFAHRPTLARVLPFVLFMLILMLRGQFPDGTTLAGWDARWLYALNLIIVGGALIYFWKDYTELARGTWPTWKEVVLAVAVGLGVFVMWINLIAPWMMLGDAAASFNPVDGEGRLLWGPIAVRWLGATLLVPVMEELFWRSFLMRWIDKPDFQSISPARTSVKAVVISSVMFMLAHTQWLAAFITGLLYAWLYRRAAARSDQQPSLWMPIIAHAVTNGVLGAWVVVTGEWRFW